MTDDDSTTCARCGETIRGSVAWWAPGHGRQAYLEQVRSLGWFPHMPRVALCRDCEAEVRRLSDLYSTGVELGPEDPDPNQNELTEFLDELDIDAFEDAGAPGMR